MSLCAVALLAVAACDGDASGQPSPGASSEVAAPSSPDTSAPTSLAPTASASSSDSPSTSEPPEPRLIGYAGGESAGVEVHDPSDVRKLHGAPAAFKRFIARTAERLVNHSTCDDAAVGVIVETLRTDGYAVGGVSDCGGYAAMWAVVDGKWKEIQGTQDAWDCRILERYQVPSTVAGTTCYDYGTGKAHDYSQA